jgi:hypothetical protein
MSAVRPVNVRHRANAVRRRHSTTRAATVSEEEARKHGGGRHSFWYIGPALLVVWFSSATAYYLFERGVDPNVANFGDAWYWAFGTATTVGYGAGTPVTAEGKVVSGVLILVSIGLVGIMSSRLVAMWLGAEEEEDVHHVEARLTHMEGVLSSMEDAMCSLQTMLARMEGRMPAMAQVLSTTSLALDPAHAGDAHAAA